MKKSLPLVLIALTALATPALAAQKQRVVPTPTPILVNNDGQLELTATRINSRAPQIYITQMGLLVSPQPQDPALLPFYEATQAYIEEILPLLKARITQWKADADHDLSLNRTEYLNAQLQDFLKQDGALARIDRIDATMVHRIPVAALDAVNPPNQTDAMKAGSLEVGGGVGSGSPMLLRRHLESCGPNGSPMTIQYCCAEVCDASGCHEWCNVCNCRTGGEGCCGYGL